MGNILRMVAHCFSLMDVMTSSRCYGNHCESLTSYFNVQSYDLLFSYEEVPIKAKAWFLSQLCPGWLKYRMLEYLLEKFSHDLVPEEKRFLLVKKLTLEKIVWKKIVSVFRLFEFYQCLLIFGLKKVFFLIPVTGTVIKQSHSGISFFKLA